MSWCTWWERKLFGADDAMPDHLCKPNLSLPVSPRWEAALGELGYYGNVFMKLSGAFNEFDAPVSSSIGDMYNAVRPRPRPVPSNTPNY